MALDFPNSPTVGQLYPSPPVAGVPVWKWDGSEWVTQANTGSTGFRQYEFTATAGQSSFSGADINGNTLAYSVGYAEVYVNGSKLNSADFTATTGTSVALASGVNVNDQVTILAFATTSTGNALLTSNNLSDVPNDTLARQNIGLPGVMKGHLFGLTLSTAGSSATFSVAAGVAVDSTAADFMSLAAAISKTTGAWAVGTGNGSWDGGGVSPASNSGWYHVYLIKRPDTGVVDVAVSPNGSAPIFGANIPAAYTLFRRIGAIKTNGSFQWVLFHQLGDEFLWDARVVDVNGVAVSTTTALVALSVPTGIQVNALYTARMDFATNAVGLFLGSPDEPDQAGGTISGLVVSSTSTVSAGQFSTRTNTSNQIRVRATNTGPTYSISTYGWIDTRGKLF